MVLKGDHAPHEGNVLLTRGTIILGTSLFERLSYYAITAPIVVFYSRELGFPMVRATQLQAVLQSIVYCLPIVGAFIADTWTGRYLVAISCIGCGAIGAFGLLCGCYWKVTWLSLLCLFCIYSFPISSVKPVLIVLGGDQFNDQKPDQLKQRVYFFGAQYWITNVGSFIANLVFNQIAVQGMGKIDKAHAFDVVFLCGVISLTIAFVFLLIGSKKLYVQTPSGSALTIFWKVTVSSLKKPKTQRGVIVCAGLLVLFFSVIASIPTFFLNQDQLGAKIYTYLMASITLICCFVLLFFGQSGDWVLHARENDPDKFDEETCRGVADIYCLAPYVAISVPFWAVYNQMNTAFVSQGCQMNNHIGTVLLGAPIIHVFNSGSIVVFIPIINTLFYPFMKKLGGKGKFTMTPLRRIGLGLFFTGLTMMVAGIIEIKRKSRPILMTKCTQEGVTNGICTAAQLGTMVPELSSCYSYTGKDASVHVPKNDMNLFLQAFEYGLVGWCEIFVAVTYYDFFYSQVPPFLRTVCAAIQMLCTTLGTMVGAVINSICSSLNWLPNDLNQGHQEYMYFINMGFSWFFMFIFMFISRSFVYKPGTSQFPGDDTVDGKPIDAVEDVEDATAVKEEKPQEEPYSYYSYSESGDEDPQEIENVKVETHG